MRLCGVNCFTLTLVKGRYEAVWDQEPGKIGSVYTVESFKPDSVILHRTDTNGATAIMRGRMSPGLNSVINGESDWLTPRRLKGTFQLSWGSTVPPAPSAAPASAPGTASAPPNLVNAVHGATLPPVIHVCSQICMTLELANGRYVSTSHNRYDPPGFHSFWAFESFAPTSVIVHRHDPPHPTNPGGAMLDVTYRGQMSSDETLLINPTTLDGQPVSLSMGWSAALALVPGNDADQEAFGQRARSQAWAAAAQRRRAKQVALAMPVPAACQVSAGIAVAPDAASHLTLCECESNDCPGADAAIWTIDGASGTGVWPNRTTIVDLTVERFDAGGVVIRRKNLTSHQWGLTAVYRGTIHGNVIEGDADWIWDGFKGGVVHGPWHAYIAGAADAKVMSQYQEDVTQAIRKAAWDNLAAMFAIGGAIGSAAGSPESDDKDTAGWVHGAVYGGEERRSQPR